MQTIKEVFCCGLNLCRQAGVGGGPGLRSLVGVALGRYPDMRPLASGPCPMPLSFSVLMRIGFYFLLQRGGLEDEGAEGVTGEVESLRQLLASMESQVLSIEELMNPRARRADHEVPGMFGRQIDASLSATLSHLQESNAGVAERIKVVCERSGKKRRGMSEGCLSGANVRTLCDFLFVCFICFLFFFAFLDQSGLSFVSLRLGQGLGALVGKSLFFLRWINSQLDPSLWSPLHEG